MSLALWYVPVTISLVSQLGGSVEEAIRILLDEGWGIGWLVMVGCPVGVLGNGSDEVRDGGGGYGLWMTKPSGVEF
ncbi:hypothetical protein RHMOL_Rhmol01G0230700 [Rhododendron molle]|uniref:Uncharacterized protein n=1 Tax=Rhododendron molle TaxID=49168 RepID=A0ACC0Q6D6_RHOML|nr:hypothetical protein RHMOL_Rhmol01G0230700 [Rhododendron molle]